jgi:hypothetical protein
MNRATRQPPAWINGATEAFHAAIKGEYDRAGELLNALGRDHRDDMPTVLLAWIDSTLTAVFGDDVEYGHGRRVASVNAAGIVDDPERSDAVHWAQALIAARLNDDQTGYEALIESVQDDRAWSANCAAVLQCCALTSAAALGGTVAP